MAVGLKDIAVGRKDLLLLPPNEIAEQGGWNVRTDGDELAEHIRSLADSIKGVPVLTDGYCRLHAVKLAISEGAEIKSVPVRVEERYSDEAYRTLSLLTRNSGKPLALHEQDVVVKRLLAFGWTEKEVVAKTGMPPGRMKLVKGYFELDAPTQEMVKKGTVSVTTAVTHVKNGDGQKLKDAAAKRLGRKVTTKDIKPRRKKPTVDEVAAIYNKYLAGDIYKAATEIMRLFEGVK